MLSAKQMRRLLPFLSFLALLLVTWTGAAAHAAEALDCASTSVTEASVHFDGDGDEVPADSDTPVPHHHGGCHGHHASLTPATASSLIIVTIDAMVGRASMRGLAGTEPGTALRPPIA